jgi:hypothetical protein
MNVINVMNVVNACANVINVELVVICFGLA